jgi:hypothetical protein
MTEESGMPFFISSFRARWQIVETLRIVSGRETKRDFGHSSLEIPWSLVGHWWCIGHFLTSSERDDNKKSAPGESPGA